MRLFFILICLFSINSLASSSGEKPHCQLIDEVIEVGFPLCGTGDENETAAMASFRYKYHKVLKECFEKPTKLVLNSINSTSSIQEVKCDWGCGFSDVKTVNVYKVCGVLRLEAN